MPTAVKKERRRVNRRLKRARANLCQIIILMIKFKMVKREVKTSDYIREYCERFAKC